MARKNGEPSNWIEFENRPKPERRHDLYRVPKKGISGLVILSPRYLGRLIHYWGGRSMPHIEPWCPACEDGNGKRATFWVAAWQPASGNQAILELTDGSIETIDDYIRRYKTLRGADFAAIRKGGRVNGKLIVQLKPSTMPEAAIPAEFDFRKELEHMWGGSLPTRQALKGEADGK